MSRQRHRGGHGPSADAEPAETVHPSPPLKGGDRKARGDVSANDLRIGGFEPFSLCDWPGKIVATLFLQGCPWRCPYCHNAELIDPNGKTDVRFADVLTFLESRRGLLDGVVFSGGEPTLQTALVPAMEDVRAMGFAVGLHSAGPYPARLKAALDHADWVGLDIKATRDGYDRMTGAPSSGARAFESLSHVLSSGIDYEVRTTVHEGLTGEAEIEALGKELAARGVRVHRLQTFRAAGVDAARLATALEAAQAARRSTR